MAKVLVVDDSLITRTQLQEALGDQGISAVIVGDAMSALEMVREDSEIELIVSDVHMPHMDGIEFITKVRDDFGQRDIKVIMLTTEDSRILKERAKDLNIIGWVVKPMNPNLAQLIKRVLGP